MGAILSALREISESISLLLTSISEQNVAFAAALNRLNHPRLPSKDTTTSFWQQRPLYPDLATTQSPQLPTAADIIIIGSGISGASIAYTILHECRAMGIQRKVTILEGRKLCSGATGRNGGHIKVSPHVEYSKLKERFGVASAKKMLKFMLMHRQVLLNVAREENFQQAEVRDVLTVDCFMEEGNFTKCRAALDVLTAEMPEIAGQIKVLDAKCAQEVTRSSSRELQTSLILERNMDLANTASAPSHTRAVHSGPTASSPLSTTNFSSSSPTSSRSRLALWSNQSKHPATRPLPSS
jgi:hypothetical protein